MSARSQGFKRGLKAVNASPVTSAHERIVKTLEAIEADHAGRISAGGDAVRLAELAVAKFQLLKQDVMAANLAMAQQAAKRFGEISSAYRRFYESPTERIASIEEAKLRIGTMSPPQIQAWADAVAAGSVEPKSHYELQVACSHPGLAAKHELRDLAEERADDFALWTREGQQAHQDMVFFANARDRIIFEGEDGGRIEADLADLYEPQLIDASAQARKELGKA